MSDDVAQAAASALELAAGLERVSRASSAVGNAREEYRAAVVAARAAGASLQAIATAAGVSRQAVHELLAGNAARERRLASSSQQAC